MNFVRMLNIDILNCSQSELLRDFTSGVLITPNVDQLVKLQKDRDFYDIVKQTEWIVCDSKILYLCSKLTSTSFKTYIPGSNFFPAFYEYHKYDEDCKIYLLGGMNDVALEAQKRINEKVGREIIIGAYSPSYGFENKTDENDYIVKLINDSGATVVLVGVGCPKQEKWIYAHKDKMPTVKVWMALGATIDFEAGNVKRAPKFFQKFALEWLYRMYCEPQRMFKRYICDDLIFFWYFMKQMLGIYKDPFKSDYTEGYKS